MGLNFVAYLDTARSIGAPTDLLAAVLPILETAVLQRLSEPEEAEYD